MYSSLDRKRGKSWFLLPLLLLHQSVTTYPSDILSINRFLVVQLYWVYDKKRREKFKAWFRQSMRETVNSILASGIVFISWCRIKIIIWPDYLSLTRWLVQTVNQVQLTRIKGSNASDLILSSSLYFVSLVINRSYWLPDFSFLFRASSRVICSWG